MGTERPPEFYDENLKNFLAPYEESIWKDLYDAVLEFLPRDRTVRVVDVGCGTGRLAEALRRGGYLNYLGFDFSEKRINEAQRYLPKHSFEVLDAFSFQALRHIESADCVCITEVLEHIERDIELLLRIPPGTHVIISVPNFDSASHVRFFSCADKAIERFGVALDMKPSSVRTLKRGKNETYVFSCRRKTGLVPEVEWRLRRFFALIKYKIGKIKENT